MNAIGCRICPALADMQSMASTSLQDLPLRRKPKDEESRVKESRTNPRERFVLRIIGVLAVLAGSPSDVFGQQKMLAISAAIPDLRCVGGFLATDGYWIGGDNPFLKRSQGWVQSSAIHGNVPVSGERPGADEPRYRVNTMYAGIRSPAMQYKVHLLKPPDAFLEILGRCNRDRGTHSIPRLAPPTRGR